MLGRLLRGVRAGSEKLVMNRAEFCNIPTTIQVLSDSFRAGDKIPARCTQNGNNVSPHMQWHDLPYGTKDTVIIIEDADAPLPFPFVHAIAYGLGLRSELPEGAIPNSKEMAEKLSTCLCVGRNTFGKTVYTGPGPVKGHGPHRYYLEVFALDEGWQCGKPLFRKELLRKMTDHVLAKGVLHGIYER